MSNGLPIVLDTVVGTPIETERISISDKDVEVKFVVGEGKSNEGTSTTGSRHAVLYTSTVPTRGGSSPKIFGERFIHTIHISAYFNYNEND
jgi:hypothetical protein